MLRVTFALLTAVVFLILSIPLLGIEWIIGRFNPRARDLSSLRIVQGVLKAVLWISGVKLTVKGREYIPSEGAVLYIGNHRSIFDIIISYSLCPDLTGYVSKIELEKIPLLSSWMRRLYCLFLDRKNLRQGMQTILTAIDQIKRGISICIFPEGSRSRGENELDLLEFHEGSFKIATRSGCPIIPMAFSGTSHIFEDHFPWIRSAEVTLEYGKPIYPAQLAKEDQKRLGSYCREQILDMLRKYQLEEKAS